MNDKKFNKIFAMDIFALQISVPLIYLQMEPPGKNREITLNSKALFNAAVFAVKLLEDYLFEKEILENFIDTQISQPWRKNYIKLIIGKMILASVKKVFAGAYATTMEPVIHLTYRLQVGKNFNPHRKQISLFEKDINKEELDHFTTDPFLWADINRMYKQLIPNLERDMQSFGLKNKDFCDDNVQIELSVILYIKH